VSSQLSSRTLFGKRDGGGKKNNSQGKKGGGEACQCPGNSRSRATGHGKRTTGCPSHVRKGGGRLYIHFSYRDLRRLLLGGAWGGDLVTTGRKVLPVVPRSPVRGAKKGVGLSAGLVSIDILNRRVGDETVALVPAICRRRVNGTTAGGASKSKSRAKHV